MFEVFIKNVIGRITLSEEEITLAKSLFQPRKLRKRQYLLQEGDPCRYTAFVEKGVLRTYTVDDKGREHILQFAFEGWWAADLYSFFTHEPSIFNIDALEDAELLLITQSSWDVLLEKSSCI